MCLYRMQFMPDSGYEAKQPPEPCRYSHLACTLTVLVGLHGAVERPSSYSSRKLKNADLTMKEINTYCLAPPETANCKSPQASMSMVIIAMIQ